MIKNLKLFNFNNSYVLLPEKFFRRVQPSKVTKPNLVAFNQKLANELKITTNHTKDELADFFSGKLIPEGADPIAMAYAGHQFGSFVPQLGDGRALLLGEVIDSNGTRLDIQLKGSGLTPFSRRGDGRAALGPVLREFIVSEAMHALGISTTRALAAVTTGEKVHRELLQPGAVLTRVARSHIRIGTFQYFKSRGDDAAIKILADYVITRLYPELKESDNPYLALLNYVINIQAKLIASWMQIGSIHGVMNTDNMSLSGETIDYGPCAFMDNYDAMKVFSFIDTQGRYAFKNQPIIGAWNLARFAESILILLHSDRDKAYLLAHDSLNNFNPLFQKYWLDGMRKKLGLTFHKDSDISLIESLLELMQAGQTDFTLTFRYLSHVIAGENADALYQMFPDKEPIMDWLSQWKRRLSEQPESFLEISQRMCEKNPLYIPRNHQIQQVILAAEGGDFHPMEQLLKVLSNPFDEQNGFESYAMPPLDFERVTQTFCGT